jgi:transposase
MEDQEIRLNAREQQRLNILLRVVNRELTVRQGAQALGLSERQMWRILSAYRTRSVAGLPHGNRGRRPHHALSESIRDRVIQLARSRYADCTQAELQEMLARYDGISISRSTVRNILVQAGIRTCGHAHRRRPAAG